LNYRSTTNQVEGLKDGILLELGFDDITPNFPRTISSWAYDFAKDEVEIIDNRAVDVACYHAGFTLVEKLQAISTKFRKQQEIEKGAEKLRADGFTGEVKILTSCPACLQGLSRYDDDAVTQADYIVVEMAKQLLGDNWMAD
jgi:Fe-S oxidoreductase